MALSMLVLGCTAAVWDIDTIHVVQLLVMDLIGWCPGSRFSDLMQVRNFSEHGIFHLHLFQSGASAIPFC
jgi:hypothetical protein